MIPVRKEVKTFPLPDGNTVDVTYYIAEYLDDTVNRMVQFMLTFYPEGMTVTKTVHSFYSASVTIRKEDAEVLFDCMTKESYRFKTPEENVEIPNVFEDFISKLEDKNDDGEVK